MTHSGTSTIISLLIIGLVKKTTSPVFMMLTATVSFIVLGILKPEAELSGFANPGMLTLVALFVVAAGLERTNDLYGIADLFFDRPKSLRVSLLRLLPISGFISIFANNTTQVAIFTPAVRLSDQSDNFWARRLLIQEFTPPEHALKSNAFAARLFFLISVLWPFQV